MIVSDEIKFIIMIIIAHFVFDASIKENNPTITFPVKLSQGKVQVMRGN